MVASGRVFVGCNVENASYGLSLCAERSAILQMVAAGEKDPIGIVVITRGPIVGTPCGACRQVLAEFALDMPVRLAVEDPAVPARMTSLAALLAGCVSRGCAEVASMHDNHASRRTGVGVRSAGSDVVGKARASTTA